MYTLGRSVLKGWARGCTPHSHRREQANTNPTRRNSRRAHQRGQPRTPLGAVCPQTPEG